MKHPITAGSHHIYLLLFIVTGVVWFIVSIISGTQEIIVCPSKLILHLPCPGCGTTTAAKMIFAGNIADGMIHNPNAVLLPLFAIIYICSYMVDIRCNEPLGRTFDTIVSQPHIKKIFLPALLLLEAAIWARNIIVHFS